MKTVLIGVITVLTLVACSPKEQPKVAVTQPIVTQTPVTVNTAPTVTLPPVKVTKPKVKHVCSNGESKAYKKAYKNANKANKDIEKNEYVTGPNPCDSIHH